MCFDIFSNKLFIKIKRYAIKEKGIMTSKSLEEYIGSIGERSETPGGGSVSAAVASMVSSIKFTKSVLT